MRPLSEGIAQAPHGHHPVPRLVGSIVDVVPSPDAQVLVVLQDLLVDRASGAKPTQEVRELPSLLVVHGGHLEEASVCTLSAVPSSVDSIFWPLPKCSRLYSAAHTPHAMASPVPKSAMAVD